MSGPRAAAESAELGYRGQRLGLPETGPGSVAGFGRRIGALVIDWFAAELAAAALARGQSGYGTSSFGWIVLGVFAAEVFLLTWLGGASFGQRLLGLRVASLIDRPLGAFRALARTVLLCLVVPAVIWDRDGRGMHDRAVASVVVRAR